MLSNCLLNASVYIYTYICAAPQPGQRDLLHRGAVDVEMHYHSNAENQPHRWGHWYPHPTPQVRD